MMRLVLYNLDNIKWSRHKVDMAGKRLGKKLATTLKARVPGFAPFLRAVFKWGRHLAGQGLWMAGWKPALLAALRAGFQAELVLR
jgi:hypothetical protein